MNDTKIEWTDKVWNVSKGCTRISEGCKNCYAEKFAKRLQYMGIEDYKDGFTFKTLPQRLNEPYKYRKPQKIFINSMSDLFHENMPDEYLNQIFDIIKETPQHTYQILTKRSYRMREYFKKREVPDNAWLGVTVENMMYGHRIDDLREINAKIRFISFEPLINSVKNISLRGINWVIVGGETGKNARIMRPCWVDEIFKLCQEYNVPFFFKQWGLNVIKNKNINKTYKGKIWHEFPRLEKEDIRGRVINLVNEIIKNLQENELSDEIKSEPINWADLKCFEAEELVNGGWLVFVSEAAPSDCPNFCNYIEGEMAKKGYNVEVITKW